MIDQTTKPDTPTRSYGVHKTEACESRVDHYVESIRRNGYAVIEPVLDEAEVRVLESLFSKIHDDYLVRHGGIEGLKEQDEHNTVRCPMSLEFTAMYEIATKSVLLDVLDRCIQGSYILNQQNLIINPAKEDYNQGAWHRDLPYQHYVSSSPLAINAILCVDEFTKLNGASYVVPGSHLRGAFPSAQFIRENAVQVEAPAGSMIIMDCMLFHSGGYNASTHPRRAINQVFSIPHIKQQISIPSELSDLELSDAQKRLLGFYVEIPRSVDEYLAGRR